MPVLKRLDAGHLLLAGSLAVFIGLALGLNQAGLQGFDQAVLDGLRTPGDPSDPVGPWWLKEAAADLTALGSMAVLGLFALAAGSYLLLKRRKGAALRLALGLAGGVALSEGLKAVFERQRPPLDYQAVETLNASFPSGHALLATVFYMGLGVLVAEALPRRRERAWVLGWAVTLTLIVGLTRVYLGAHWPSDVLAGWCVGLAWALVLGLAARRMAHLSPS